MRHTQIVLRSGVILLALLAPLSRVHAQDTQPSVEPALGAPTEGTALPEVSGMPTPEASETAEAQKGAVAPGETLPTVASPASEPSLAPTSTATDANVDAAAIEAELRAIEVSAAQEPSLSLAKPDKLRFYGFIDFGTRYDYNTDGAPADKFVLFPDSSNEFGGVSFVPANTHLYLDAQPLETTRVLLELRFTLLGQDPQRSSYVATVADQTSAFSQGVATFAAVMIERAQIEQHIFDWLQVRAGMWLTPWGIWNEDHAIPTLISMYLPQFIIGEQVPVRQLGVQLFGGVRLSDYRIDYNAYVSNGRIYSVQSGENIAPVRDVFDYDNDKSYGYRLRFSRGFPFYFHVGHSFYHGTYEEISRDIPTVDGPGVGKVIGWREYSLAFDAAVDYRGLRLRSEFIMTAYRYDAGFEPAYREGVRPDRNIYDVYLITAYKLPYERIPLEPYFYWETARRPSGIGDTFVIGSLGLNYYINSASQLKLQWIAVSFFDHADNVGVAWVGLPSKKNKYHTGKGLDLATGSPGSLALRYVVTF